MMRRMFERMADASRRVLGLAREESRRAGQRHIGTEHLLLGLFSVPVTGELLGGVGIALDPIREQAGRTLAPPVGSPVSPAFTPRAKKVLELSLREALDRQSPSIEPRDIRRPPTRTQGGRRRSAVAGLVTEVGA